MPTETKEPDGQDSFHRFVTQELGGYRATYLDRWMEGNPRPQRIYTAFKDEVLRASPWVGSILLIGYTFMIADPFEHDHNFMMQAVGKILKGTSLIGAGVGGHKVFPEAMKFTFFSSEQIVKIGVETGSNLAQKVRSKVSEVRNNLFVKNTYLF